MKHQQMIHMTRTAVLAALTAIATMVIPIPIPGGGYANAGDIVILITAFLLGPLFVLLKKHVRPFPAMLLSGIAGELVMVTGYYGFEALILQSVAAAAAGLVPNLLQGTAGVAGALVLMPALERTFRLLERTRSPQG